MHFIKQIQSSKKLKSLIHQPQQQSSLSESSTSINMMKFDRGLVKRSLLYSLERGYFSFVRYLLESGVDSNERDLEDRTPLMYCCFIDDNTWSLNIALSLLEFGAKIQYYDKRGLNSLMYAIINQRTILVHQFLSSLDFDLNQATDIYGNTSLHYACYIGNVEIVRLVVACMKRYSIDITKKNSHGASAYDVACSFHNNRCKNLVRNEMALDQRCNNTKSNHNNQNYYQSITITPIITSQRRVSTPGRIHSAASSHNGSALSVPSYVLSSWNIRKKRRSIVLNENNVLFPTLFVKPTDSQSTTLKRNDVLDKNLTKQVKNRQDYAPSRISNNNNDITLDSSSTPSLMSNSWKEQFQKVFDNLQTSTSRSYRKTINPPLDDTLPCELFEKLYGMGHHSDSHDCGSANNTELKRLMQSSNKNVHRRGSLSSIASSMKSKK